MFELHEPTFNGRPPSKPDPLLSSWLDGRFLIEERIATGGFGAIYRASTSGGLPVALKVLHPALVDDPNMVARFQREGAILTQLHDPHTVTTFAVGEAADGTLYIAMELLSGESLQDRLRRERALPWQTAVAIARAVCSSLAEVHALGVVHRDLKPANIHVERRGGAEHVKVLDFGIVKLVRGSAIDDGQDLTFAGHMIGTCDYMSPEQIVGGACDDASDIYSLGVVLYEMLTGQRPFAEASTPAAMMTALLTQTPLPPSALAAVPPALDRIVMRCLQREPQHRFSSVIELAAMLGRALAPRASQREEITAVHPVWSGNDAAADGDDDGATFRDDVRIRGARDAGSDRRPRAVQARTWVGNRAAWSGAPQRIATGTGPVSCAPQSAPDAPAPVQDPSDGPLFATLPGVAVATDRSRGGSPLLRPGHRGLHPRTTSVVAPVTWPSAAVWPSIPSPGIRCEPLARGSSPTLQARSQTVFWAVIVLASIAAILVAAAI
jgi:serine/threonine-protein kinase